MVRQRLAVLAWLFGAVVMGLGASAARAAGGGHGAGAGHSLAGAGYGRGYGGYGGYGGFGRGYGYGWGGYGYPGFFGLGLGLGLGYDLAYGYPYPYPYPYPVYVDVGGVPPPPGVMPQGGPVVGQAPGPLPPGAQAGGQGPVRLTETDVLLSIRVPPNAIVRINGTQTNQSGPRREFMSSGLEPGRSYTFVVTAHWTGPDGQVVDLERRIPVQGGERRNVDFNVSNSQLSTFPKLQ